MAIDMSKMTLEEIAFAKQHLNIPDRKVELPEPKKERRCPDCGYTQADKMLHGDHHLCPGHQRNAKRKQKPLKPTTEGSALFVQKIRIPHWHPTPLNRLLKTHWAVANRYKSMDRDIIQSYANVYGMKPATGHRTVRLTIHMRPKQRAADPDAYWKSLLDALVHAKLLVDDSRTHCTLGGVEFLRGAEVATTIELEDKGI